MPNWRPIFALPNIEVRTKLENRVAALVPHDDPRVRQICHLHPEFAVFLSRFTDAYRSPAPPGILLLRDDVKDNYRTIEALGGFRDLVCLSALPRSRALTIATSQIQGILFSDSFAFYPWMIASDYDGMIAQTPAMLASHELDEFHGQTSPELSRQILDDLHVDQTLIKELMKRWVRRFKTRKAKWEDEALFRSLAMATSAAKTPSATSPTLYDIGRQLALWVSAFEILTHPGGAGQANRETVFKRLECVHWQLPFFQHATYNCYREQKNKPLRNAACELYSKIYQLRNDYLHGNPVSRTALFPVLPPTKPSKVRMHKGRPIHPRRVFADYSQYAAILYRIAVGSFLGLDYSKPKPDSSKLKQSVLWLMERSHYFDSQKDCEEALRTAWA